jgi:cell wall-associated NlpC family hydrolase
MLFAAQSRHRVPGTAGHSPRLPIPRSPLSRQSTLTMLAVSAVGAGAAMTGQFPAISASDAGGVQDAAHPVFDDVLVTDPGSPSVGHTAAVAAVSTLPAPTTERSVPSGAATAAVLSGDTHQTDARDIAALARSVDMERAMPASGPSSLAPESGPGGTSSALSAVGLGGGGPLGSAPGAMMRATAMNAALSKIGVPYVWGAAGPRAFDCSGLVLWAFNRVGISLPHSSAAQSRIGAPVAKSDLRPGDLVFFYTPVSHVGMYIGNGKVVHASEPGQPVKISQINRMPFHNARRLSS